LKAIGVAAMMISFKVAVRFLKSGGGQTVLMVVGIGIAISVQIFVGLLINSLQQSLVDSTMGRSPHITITSSVDDVTIRRWENMVDDIEQIAPVEVVSVSASGNAFARRGSTSKPVLVRGFDFETADRIYNISDSIYKGSPYQLRSEVIVGKDLSEELELDIGDRLTVSTPGGTDSALTVSGLYDLGASSINKTWLITKLETARKMFGFGSRVTSIEVTVSDLFKADRVANKLEKALDNNNIKVENWKEQNQQLLRGLEGQRISSAIIQAIILVSVIVAISSVLAISVLQKTRQIGILKAMGIKDRDAGLIFLYQGFLIGLVGSLLGIALGLSLVYAFVAFTTVEGQPPLFEFRIQYDFILRSWLIALFSATLAAIVPARNSLKLSPVDVIRER